MRRGAWRIIIRRVEPSGVGGIDTVLRHYCIAVLVEPASGARCTDYHPSDLIVNPRILDR